MIKTEIVFDKLSLKTSLNNLKRFETRLVKKELRKIVKETGNILLEEIKASTPVDTGDLKRNIRQKVRVPKNRGGIHSLIGAKWIQGDENPYIKFWSLNPSKNRGAEGKRLRGAKSFGFAMDAVNRKRKSAENYFYKEMRNLVGRFK
jgi:hypothetical protein